MRFLQFISAAFLSGLLAVGCATQRPAPEPMTYSAPPGSSETAPTPSAPEAPETFPSQDSGLADVPAAKPGEGVRVTPDQSMSGKVALVNQSAKYVVVSFPIGAMPAMGKAMSVYRSGLKVGELKITGPQRDFDTVADIVNGSCQVGDEVRGNAGNSNIQH